MIAVFDGHNDFLQRAVTAPDAAALWARGDGTGHLDLPRARAGGFAGGFFAIWIPVEDGPNDPAAAEAMENPPFSMPLPPPAPYSAALPHAMAQASALMAMARSGTLDIVRSVADIRRAMDAGRIAAILHMEGAEALDTPEALYLWHAMGLRSLGPVWSRPTRYGHGVPFAFPASPDIGDGLTQAGRDLVRVANALRIMLDLSHLNEAGFWDVARLSDAPLVASHSCAHAISASARNLTDRQLDAIADSGGLVGLNFAVSFLREDGRRLAFQGFEPMLRHLDHLLNRLGENGVALGSDFDGALVPQDLASVDRLPGLIDAMRAHGYDNGLIRKIAAENWLSVLDRTWGG
ncbi:MAG: membrane dipeptidase [Paracoccus sp. (in: a-proteobacteria)]|uniref:dipeptidase n=1 Tax=Paracoccus sp. TaxID=267 RepID=UPI0026E0C79C|nr:membrane dipeptidase [Paracoccus sp. (in: a-proteobacteria)]MDO5613834.1 membrane dipeptidase [Paracoccus sp. (in: a-proteobacteria)]